MTENQDDIVEQLVKLVALRDAGALSESEFQTVKAHVLRNAAKGQPTTGSRPEDHGKAGVPVVNGRDVDVLDQPGGKDRKKAVVAELLALAEGAAGAVDGIEGVAALMLPPSYSELVTVLLDAPTDAVIRYMEENAVEEAF